MLIDLKMIIIALKEDQLYGDYTYYLIASIID